MSFVDNDASMRILARVEVIAYKG